MDIIKETLECRVLNLIERLVTCNNPLCKESFKFSLVPESLGTLLRANHAEKMENIQPSD